MPLNELPDGSKVLIVDRGFVHTGSDDTGANIGLVYGIGFKSKDEEFKTLYLIFKKREN